MKFGGDNCFLSFMSRIEPDGGNPVMVDLSVYIFKFDAFDG